MPNDELRCLPNEFGGEHEAEQIVVVPVIWQVQLRKLLIVRQFVHVQETSPIFDLIIVVGNSHLLNTMKFFPIKLPRTRPAEKTTPFREG